MTHLGMYIDEAAAAEGRLQAEGDQHRRSGTRSRACSTGRGAAAPTSSAASAGAGSRASTRTRRSWREVRHEPRDDRELRLHAGRPRRRREPQMPVIKRGETLTFYNADQAATIRHTVTTCPWPCNGTYVGNYPLADGALGLGHDGLRPDRQGADSNPVAETPKDLSAGRRTRTSAASTRGCAARSRSNRIGLAGWTGSASWRRSHRSIPTR